jgi:2'-5' RNA ligase
MPKWRLGVALLLPEPVRSEVQGLRRAMGDGGLDRIAPHITLVPPVNVNVSGLDDALTVIRSAGHRMTPFSLKLGPINTFAPATPVIKLDVSGELDQLDRLRDLVFTGPLQRSLTWPFSPHVTLKDEATHEQLRTIPYVLTGFESTVQFDRVHLLREDERRRWTPVADAPFAPGSFVGRGGLELELSTSQLIDPVAARLLDGRVPATDLVITARRDGATVGVTAGKVCGDDLDVRALFVHPEFRMQGIGSHLIRHLLAEASGLGCELAVLALDFGEESSRSFFEKLGFHGGVRTLH